MAVARLKKEHFSILARNYRTKCGEIDIVARKKGVIYFVEVKTRGGGSLVRPEEALGPRQRERIRRCAQLYLMRNPALEMHPCSFALMAIDLSSRPPRVECMLDAFE